MMDDVEGWKGRLVDGRFPLRQYLGGSEHSAVFLTERGPGQSAAIKFVPFDSATADPQLARWRQAAELSHPHLLRIFETGRCRIEDAGFLFVVMEYAEEDLSQILPQRALTPGEAQQMLGPVVEALRYLHGRGWVHGHLRPSNILASGDQVKLSSDRMGKVGEAQSGVDRASVYDPPEKGKGGNSAAGDVWALGVTLTESLTRQLPRANGSDRGELRLPEGLTSPFLDIARNCLWRDPRQRWALPEIAAQLGPSPAGGQKEAAEAAHKEQPVVAPAVEPAGGSGVPQEPTSRSRWLWAVVVAAVIAGGVYLVRYRPQGEATSPPAVEHKPVPSTPEGMPSRASTEQPTAEKPSPAPAPETSADETVARYVPAIPKSARETIQGRVKVRVRVNVDASGNVVGSKVDLHGPSDYFARQAQQAAMRWKFSPSPEEKRQWVLQFEFARGGTQVFPSRVKGNH